MRINSGFCCGLGHSAGLQSFWGKELNIMEYKIIVWVSACGVLLPVCGTPPAEGNKPCTEQGFFLKGILWRAAGMWWGAANPGEGWSAAGSEGVSHGVLVLCRWWTRCLEARCTRRAFGRMECSASPWTTPAHSSGAHTFPAITAITLGNCVRMRGRLFKKKRQNYLIIPNKTFISVVANKQVTHWHKHIGKTPIGSKKQVCLLGVLYKSLISESSLTHCECTMIWE